jgi:hypothetical protein
MACLQVADRGHGLQIWRVAASKASSLGVEQGANNYSPPKKINK